MISGLGGGILLRGTKQRHPTTNLQSPSRAVWHARVQQDLQSRARSKRIPARHELGVASAHGQVQVEAVALLVVDHWTRGYVIGYWLSITKNLRLLMLDSYSVKSSKSLKPLVFWRENKPVYWIRVTNNRSIQTSNYKLIQNTHLQSLRCHSFWNIVVQFSKKCNRTHFVRVFRWRQSHIVFAQESLGFEPYRRQPRRWGGVQYHLLPLCYHNRLNKSRSWTYQRGKC